MGWYGNFRPYVSVAKRRAKAAKEMSRLAKKGRAISPVTLEGHKIATTFWGKAWCDNLESYSDFSNRLPRGRTYIRNGSVVDLQIEAGKISAIVSGSELYEVSIKITPLAEKIWSCLKGECGGKIGSLIELLQGRLAQGVMELVTRKPGGLFPAPAEIKMSCSCPDWAGMCKHVAAVMYGVGARLDRQPDLLFALRQVDHLDLITAAGAPKISTASAADRQTIASEDLSDVFGIELDAGVIQPSSPPVSEIAKLPKKRIAARMKSSGTAPRRSATVAKRQEDAEVLVRSKRPGVNARKGNSESVKPVKKSNTGRSRAVAG